MHTGQEGSKTEDTESSGDGSVGLLSDRDGYKVCRLSDIIFYVYLILN